MGSFGSSWGGALLSSIPIIGQYFQGQADAAVARENTDKTIAANREMAEYQYSKDLDMWNRGNLYNSPTAQMDRLKAAGLNPNMVYGNGAVGNASGQLPKYSAPTAEYNYKAPVNLPATLGAYQDFQIRNAQLDNLRAQRRAIEANIEYTGDRGSLVRTQQNRTATLAGTDYLKQEQMKQMFPYQLEFASGRNRNLDFAAQKLASDIRYRNLQSDWYTESVIGGLAGKAFPFLNKFLPGQTRSMRTGKLFKGEGAVKRNPITGRIDQKWLFQNGY